MSVDSISDDIQTEALLKKQWFWGVAIILAIVVGGVWILFSRTISGGVLSGGDAVVLEPAQSLAILRPILS